MTDTIEINTTANTQSRTPLTIDGYTLVMTCPRFPEQYDVFKDDQPAGYLRLRHGEFTASYPDVDGECILYLEPDGEGHFTDEERPAMLERAIRAIDAYRKFDDTHDDHEHLAQKLDELSGLSAHWERNRMNGRTPRGIAEAMLQVMREILEK